jgi:hypothetical protein
MLLCLFRTCCWCLLVRVNFSSRSKSEKKERKKNLKKRKMKGKIIRLNYDVTAGIRIQIRNTGFN